MATEISHCVRQSMSKFSCDRNEKCKKSLCIIACRRQSQANAFVYEIEMTADRSLQVLKYVCIHIGRKEEVGEGGC